MNHPKFEIGDTLETDQGNEVVVLDINNKDYKLSSVTGAIPYVYHSINYVDKKYKLIKKCTK